jgi:hypothetical protein
MTGPGQPVRPLQGLAATALSAVLTFVGIQTNYLLLEVLFDRLQPATGERRAPDDSGRIVNV